MKWFMEYKSYYGSIEESGVMEIVLYGKIEFIRDLVMYHEHSLQLIEQSFKEAVDQYLDDCKELHREPNKTAYGSLEFHSRSV